MTHSLLYVANYTFDLKVIPLYFISMRSKVPDVTRSHLFSPMTLGTNLYPGHIKRWLIKVFNCISEISEIFFSWFCLLYECVVYMPHSVKLNSKWAIYFMIYIYIIYMYTMNQLISSPEDLTPFPPPSSSFLVSLWWLSLLQCHCQNVIIAMVMP